MVEAPPVGCSTEDLRLYVLQVVRQQSLDVTALEVHIAESVNPITRALEDLNKESQAVKKDVSVFTTIKNYVTESELEARTTAINEDMKTLTAQAKSFTEHLDAYLQRTEAMEDNFQRRVATAFAKVESDFAEIKKQGTMRP